MSEKSSNPRPKGTLDKQIALALQGGGALGSYQAGVYEALAEHDYKPDLVAGVSIGAINCAIIAGNASEDRVARLRQFWEQVSSPTADWLELPQGIWQDAIRRTAAMAALMFGQPGFFRPNIWHSWITGTNLTSYYDTSYLKATLERLVDFDRINAREMRFCVGAVNLRTGNHIYFDNSRQTIRPEHVMASGALPPGFPAIEIDGEHYWDGGVVSNTPLHHILEAVPRRSTLAFQVDLYSSHGGVPKDLVAVSEREYDIRYSSRTRMGVETFRYAHNLRRNISTLLAKLPDALKNEPEVAFLQRAACQTSMDIVHLIYRPEATQGPSKNFEFSRATMERRWEQGLRDARLALATAPWLVPAPPDVAVRTFDVSADKAAAASGRRRESHAGQPVHELLSQATRAKPDAAMALVDPKSPAAEPT
jgi:NTE family protein